MIAGERNAIDQARTVAHRRWGRDAGAFTRLGRLACSLVR